MFELSTPVRRGLRRTIGSPAGSRKVNITAKISIRTAPRARFERATYCLGGMIRAWLDEAGHSLMRYLPAATIAGRGWVSPDVCRRWLPVWLPGISLAPLTLMPHLPTEDAGVAVATATPAPHPAHMPTWPAGTGSDCGRPGRSAAASVSQAGEGASLRFPPRRIDARSCRDGSGRATDARIALLTRRMRWAAGLAGSPGFAMRPARIRSARWIVRAWC